MSAPAPLAERIPPRTGTPPDELLDLFLGHVRTLGLELYPAQEEAILELFAGNNVILETPTGSGKSLVALALHFLAMREGRRSFYTRPIKALVNEKFFALCRDFGPENVGMITGDAAVNRDAPIICCTAEILANMALREGNAAPVDYVVMDEFHYYADRERGVAWQVPLLLLERMHASCSCRPRWATPSSSRRSCCAERAGPPSPCARHERPVPLEFEYRETPLHETIQDLVTQGPRARLPRELHAARGAPRGAEPDEHGLLQQGARSARSPRRSAKRALRHALRQGDAALPVATASACTTRAFFRSTGCSSRSSRSGACSRSSAAPTRSASA